MALNSAGSYQTLCYGKLPGFGDFVRYNASGRELQMFDRWLQEGLHTAQRGVQQWDAVYKFAPSYHFFLPIADQALLGALYPSRDKSGRKYPFFIALKLDYNQFTPPNNEHLPVMFEPFFAKAFRAISAARSGTNSREIIPYIEESGRFDWQESVRERENYDAFLWKTEQKTFWEETLGDFDDKRKLLLFKNLIDIYGPFRAPSRENISQLRYGLRFPLAKNKAHASHSAAFWLEVSTRLLGNPSLLPWLFWTRPEDGRDARLFMFFRQPSPQVFLKLMQPDADSDRVSDLEIEGGDALDGIESKLGGQFVALLGLENLKLNEFLREIRIIGRS